MCDHQISPMKKMKAIVETQRLSEDLEVPVFDMSPLLYSKDEKKISKLCESMGKAMAETSILIVRDPRVSKTDSGNFLDMMERYFSQERELLDEDVRAELQYVDRVTLIFTLKITSHHFTFQQTAIKSVRPRKRRRRQFVVRTTNVKRLSTR